MPAALAGGGQGTGVPAPQGNGSPGSGAPQRRGVPAAAAAAALPPPARAVRCPPFALGLETAAGIPGGSERERRAPEARPDPRCSVARWARRAPRQGGGPGGGAAGRGGTHVDRQRPRVDGGLGPHGRLEPQLQLLPHVGARGRRTMLVGRLGEGRGAAGGGGAGGRRRAGGRAGG